MKTMKKYIAFILLLSVCVIAFASCDDKRESAIASFDGNYIYADDSDYKDIYNLNLYYYTHESGDTEMSSYEYNQIFRESVETVVTMRLLEQEISARGFSVDMMEVRKSAKEDEEIFDRVYTGGFEKFCKHWDLSSDVFLLTNKFEAIRDIVKENFVQYAPVTEEEVRSYYEENERMFFKNPHYQVSEIYLQVLDPASVVNRDSVFNDAKVYIEMLNHGKPWQNVANTAAMKYNRENGMVFSHYLTGKRVISKYDFRDVVSLNTAINDLNEKFKFINGVSFEEMFPRGFEEYINLKGYKKNSVEYNKAWETYVKYCSEKYDLEYRYAITTAWDTGKAYTTPIYHGVYNCYVVITFTDVEEDAGFISFENAKDDIYNNMKTERQNKAFDDYISSMIGNTDVQIKYNR